MPSTLRFAFLAATALGGAQPLLAQAPAQVPTAANGKRVYTPADFARFAPKTAYDMLVQVPSFTIRGAESDRGLGQASENVLINGQRVANKSGGAIDQLQRVSAGDVERVEILDAASLGIAGLSGQVANFILKATRSASGQFEWNPSARAHYARPSILAGLVSYSGKSGPLDYTLSIKNSPGRGAFGGPVTIYDRDGVLTERRFEVFHSEFDEAKMQAKFGLDGPGSSLANLTLGYAPYWGPAVRRDRRFLETGEVRSRDNHQTLTGYYYDINGDFDFRLGPGRLKLIGLRHFDHEPLVVTQVLSFDSSGDDPNGVRFSRNSHIGETIGRGEYRWKSGRNDWQVSFERAFNSLDQKGGLFELQPSGDFVEVPFPEGSVKVTEVRYEGIATLSRPLAPNLDLQVAAGAEHSTLDRVPDDQAARKFFRPKGSVVFGWRPSKGWDVSLKLRRRVGQISFYDFLSQPQLSQDRQNAGNPDLVPPQSWELETEFARDLGAWGKTRLNLHYYRVQDIIDVIPIGGNGQGVGNLPRADRLGGESTSTILFDPIGWKGAKLDVSFGAERTSVRDPLTGDKRPISGVRDRWASAEIRHDIPGTPFAWDVSVAYRHYTRNYFLTEVFRSLDLPFIASFYVEHKSLLGTTVRLSVDNVLNGRHLLDRRVYSGFRDRRPIAFIEKHDQLVGPIFNLSVKGTF